MRKNSINHLNPNALIDSQWENRTLNLHFAPVDCIALAKNHKHIHNEEKIHHMVECHWTWCCYLDTIHWTDEPIDHIHFQDEFPHWGSERFFIGTFHSELQLTSLAIDREKQRVNFESKQLKTDRVISRVDHTMNAEISHLFQSKSKSTQTRISPGEETPIQHWHGSPRHVRLIWWKEY